MARLGRGFPVQPLIVQQPYAAAGAGFTNSPSSSHAIATVPVTATGTGTNWTDSNPFSITGGTGSGSIDTYQTAAGGGTATSRTYHLVITALGTFTIHDSDSNTDQTYNASAIAPGPPTSVVASDPHDGTISVTFVAPSDTGGAAITGYTATPSGGPATDSNAGSTALTHVLTGGTLGSSITVGVTATNSAGTGSAGTSGSVTPTTVPGAPTSVVGTATGATTGSVTGTAPAITGGTAITGYVADDGSGGHTTASGALPRPMSGLSTGVAVTPRLAAVNAVGQGAWGTAGASFTPQNTVNIIVPMQALTTDTLGTKQLDLFQVVSGALSQIGSTVTTGFVDSGNGNILNAWDNDLVANPNGAYGDFYGFGRFNNVNSGGCIWVPVYSPPTSNPATVIVPEMSTFVSDDTIGVTQNKTLVLSALTVGTGRTATAGSATFAGTSADHGQFITEAGGGPGRAIITGHTSTTVCTVTIIEAFSGTNISANGWAFGQPGYALRFFGGTFGARVTSGIIALTGGVNQFGALLTLTPPDQLQYDIDWDCGN